MRTSQTGGPLRASSCWLAALLSSSSRLDVVSVDSSSGGDCSSAPRGGELIPVEPAWSPPPPPQPASSSAATPNGQQRRARRINLSGGIPAALQVTIWFLFRQTGSAETGALAPQAPGGRLPNRTQ